jgi:hypothetical protein
VSLGTKVLRKWEGPTWDHERTSVVWLLTERAVIEKLAYVMANPVKAGLVQYARDWPGVTVLPHELGRRTFRIERPAVFFDPNNPQWPDVVELSLTLPPTHELRAASGPQSDLRRRAWSEDGVLSSGGGRVQHSHRSTRAGLLDFCSN